MSVITQEKQGLFGGDLSVVDPAKYIGCAKCLQYGPGEAIVMKEQEA